MRILNILSIKNWSKCYGTLPEISGSVRLLDGHALFMGIAFQIKGQGSLTGRIPDGKSQKGHDGFTITRI